MNNVLKISQELQESSDSKSNLIKNLVRSMNDFALNQSHLIQHKNNPTVPFAPILSKIKKKSSNYSHTKQAKLTKRLIEAADRINLRKLKLTQTYA